MALFIYGTKAFTSFKGYFGQKEECPNCHKVYKKGFTKVSRWAHIDYIPLFPVGSSYIRFCPVCGNGDVIKSKEAKEIMAAPTDPEPQDITVYAKHILANKPQGFLATDTSYEVWIKDNISGEEMCLATNSTKDYIKSIKKNRGIKNIQIIDVQ